MPTDKLIQAVLACVRKHQGAAPHGVAAGAIERALGVPRISINRALSVLVQQGRLDRLGAGRAVTYRISPPNAREGTVALMAAEPPAADATPARGNSPGARRLLKALQAPLGTRKPVSYQRAFVDHYVPNETSLLPATLAAELAALGRTKDQQPAGTYARKVLEQLLIDLSWFSSRLEGNRTSLLDTRALFERGRSEGDDRDATMLLNHKEAIEFMVDAVPTEGITVPVVRNLQSLLMRDLLSDPADLGAIRSKLVNIQDTVYVPSQVPGVLEQMLRRTVDKVRYTRNPVEAAFFLWVNIAYLQPFVDGNKRTSRLGANMPLMLANCAPLSFLDVEQADYAYAMLGIYERLDVTLAVELFEWTYRRSIQKYEAILASLDSPDPLRIRYREQLGEAVRQVVHHETPFSQAIVLAAIPAEDAGIFTRMLDAELAALQPYNCARHRLSIGRTDEWIRKGRRR
jgi:Fic family protein